MYIPPYTWASCLHYRRSQEVPRQTRSFFRYMTASHRWVHNARRAGGGKETAYKHLEYVILLTCASTRSLWKTLLPETHVPHVVAKACRHYPQSNGDRTTPRWHRSKGVLATIPLAFRPAKSAIEGMDASIERRVSSPAGLHAESICELQSHSSYLQSWCCS